LPATVFVNPAAGGGGARRKVARARQAFARRNFPVKIVETRSREEFRSSVRLAIGEGCTTLIAMGGDGTVQLLVREVIGRDARVGVMPAGGGNDFAAALGVSRNLEDAAEAIVRGKCRLVDVVGVQVAGGHQAVYLGGGGMGLDADAVRYAAGRFLMWPGKLRYLASAIVALRGFSGIQVNLEFPDNDLPPISKKVLLAAVLNTPTCGGGLRLAPQAQVDDGMLEVVLLEMLSRREVLALIPRLLVTGELKTKRTTRLRAPSVRISAPGQLWFQGDGELLGIAPVEVRAMPRALCVLAP
jgi:Sphingosine kinase and enzymes related to eukaryotic diacylglycerol kinase